MPSQDNSTSKSVLLPLAIAIASAIGMLVGFNMNLNNDKLSLINVTEKQEQSIVSDGRIEEILRFIETNYVDSLDENQVVVDAINHILRQLDPHSNYITPEELNDHNEKMEGVYKGIGIETIKLRDTFYITYVREDSPAYAKELQPGDAIIGINEDTISGNNSSFEQMRELLRAGESDPVRLTYKKVDQTELSQLEIEPQKLTLHSADLAYLLDSETAYVKISRFNANTYEQFIKSLERIVKENQAIDLVIDLRDNPGGFLPETVNILSQLFADKDKMLTYTEGLNRKKQEYRTTGRQFFNIDKIAILINENSASGSEILAGAIQDWDRGFIIGRSSFGKGLVQEIFPLSNGGALRLTVSKYYTPSGRLIQKSYDNIDKDFVADTSDYSTMMLNRTVIGGGGVTPDVMIDVDYNNACFNLHDYIDYFIINMMVEQGTYDIATTALTQSNLLEFIDNEYVEDAALLATQCNANTLHYLESRLKRIQEGEVTYQQFLNANDPYILKAIELLNDKKTTLALLSEKN
jgi:carboxyl-terminal processing protease